jgi:hypothetical protein
MNARERLFLPDIQAAPDALRIHSAYALITRDERLRA